MGIDISFGGPVHKYQALEKIQLLRIIDRLEDEIEYTELVLKSTTDLNQLLESEIQVLEEQNKYLKENRGFVRKFLDWCNGKIQTAYARNT